MDDGKDSRMNMTIIESSLSDSIQENNIEIKSHLSPTSMGKYSQMNRKNKALMKGGKSSMLGAAKMVEQN